VSELTDALNAAATRRTAAHDAARAALADAYNAAMVAHCAADDAYLAEIDRIERAHRAVTVDA
jgi:hypothetical protein